MKALIWHIGNAIAAIAENSDTFVSHNASQVRQNMNVWKFIYQNNRFLSTKKLELPTEGSQQDVKTLISHNFGMDHQN